MDQKCVMCGFVVDKPNSLCVACEEKRQAKPVQHWQLKDVNHMPVPVDDDDDGLNDGEEG